MLIFSVSRHKVVLALFDQKCDADQYVPALLILTKDKRNVGAKWEMFCFLEILRKRF